MNKIDLEAEAFYVRMIVTVDDWGRCESSAALLRPKVFPLRLERVREADLTRWLKSCEQASLIRRYTVQGKEYLQMMQWEKGRAIGSRHPPPPPEIANICLRAQTDVCTSLQMHPTPTPVPTPISPPTAREGNEIPTLEQAEAQSMSLAVPKDFIKYVFDDWSSRGGKDGGGNVVGLLPYLAKRWTRESTDWKNKTHRGNKANENSKSDNPRNRGIAGMELRNSGPGYESADKVLARRAAAVANQVANKVAPPDGGNAP